MTPAHRIPATRIAPALALFAAACTGGPTGPSADLDAESSSAEFDLAGQAMADAAIEPVAPVGRWQSYFNEPGPQNDYSDNTLRDLLVTYINGAVPGSEIRAHITTLSGAASMRVVPDALVAAHDRGVDIWMVHNADSFFFPELAARLGDRYVHCETPEAENNSACLSSVDDGTHHMKNWYFSHVDLGSNVYEQHGNHLLVQHHGDPVADVQRHAGGERQPRALRRPRCRV
jgi:hypothetical protein